MIKKLMLILILLCAQLPAQAELESRGVYTPNFFAELLDAEMYSDEMLYIVGVGGFIFVNVADPDNPKFKSRYNPGSIYTRFYNGKAAGNLAAGAARRDGLYLINIGQLDNPKLHAIYSLSNEKSQYKNISYESVDFKNNTAYAAIHGAGLEVIAISDPKLPRHIKIVNEPKNAWDVFIDGSLLYVADGDGGLKIFSLTDPRNPRFISTIATSGPAFEVIVENKLAYVAMGASGMDIIDVADPQAPKHLSQFEIPSGILNHLNYDDGFIYAATWDLILTIDVSNPAFPRLTGSKYAGNRAMGVAAYNGTAYVTDWYDLKIFSFSPRMQPDIMVKPYVFDFGFAGDNVPVIKTFKITNLGEQDLLIDSIYAKKTFYSFDQSELHIGPGREAELKITMTPTHDTNLTDQVHLESNDPDNTLFKIRVFGGSSGASVGDRASDFSLPALRDEQIYTLSEMRGKVVVLSLFASW